MSHTENIKTELKKGLDDLTQLKDEIELKLHLAGMDLKKEWNHLQKEIYSTEQDVKIGTNQATRDALDMAIAKLKKFRAALH